ncbi:MAG: signal recognition particle receptor subunit alpha [Candidatus Marsarchaeota archaeon]|nr:signal recognition particle receptor subunit alpha [Candidatus Marsarchaeota archaeon]
MDLGSGVRSAISKITGAGVVDEKAINDLVIELQRALISSDVNVKLVFEITEKIKEKALKEKNHPSITLREKIVKIVYDELVSMLGEKYEPSIQKKKILVFGLNASGKTTTIAKLAKFYLKRGLKTGVIAGDIHRPAAIEQLKQLSEEVKCDFFERGKLDPKALALEGLKTLKDDVVIFDSAGRSAFDDELKKELKDIYNAFNPDETFLVVSADIGQVAGKQAEEFSKTIPVSGVIITKMDGSGKGGGALTSTHSTGSRIAFIGTGEKPDDLEVFDSTKFISRLVGYADLETLLEKVKEVTEEKELTQAIETGAWNYTTFMIQLKSMRKIGPMKKIMQLLGLYDIPEEFMDKSEDKLKKFEAAVSSMTEQERKNPAFVKVKSRQERIARGAGIKPEEMRELVTNFDRVEKMYKGLKKNKGMLKKFGNIDLSKLGGL